MQITPPPSVDDHNVESLRRTNRANGEVKQTPAVDPAPRVDAGERSGEKGVYRGPERRRAERRQGDRRSRRDPVLLDTRAPDDRRKRLRRRSDREAVARDARSGGPGTTPRRRGVDLMG